MRRRRRRAGSPGSGGWRSSTSTSTTATAPRTCSGGTRPCCTCRCTATRSATTRTSAAPPTSGSAGCSPSSAALPCWCRKAATRSRRWATVRWPPSPASRPAGSAVLDDGQDVAGRVLEPGDLGAAGGAHDPLLVLGEAVVALEANPPRGQLVDGLVDVVDREVEDRVGGRREVGAEVHHDVAAAARLHLQHAVLRVRLADPQAERLPVERPGRLQVVDREAAVCLAVLEHQSLRIGPVDVPAGPR